MSEPKPKKSNATQSLESIEELQAYIAFIESDKKYDKRHPWLRARDLLIAHLIISSGLRISDIVKLEIADFSNPYVGKKITVEQKKTKTDHNIYITERLVKALNKYFTELGNYGVKQKIYLIKSHKTLYSGGMCSSDAISKAMKRIGDGCGMSTSTSSHCLRKTAATMRMHQGVGIDVISQWLHKGNILSTLKYLKMDSERVKEVATHDVLG